MTNFRWLILTRTFSVFSLAVAHIGMFTLAETLTHSPLAVSVVQALIWGSTLAALFTGTMLDRWDRRRAALASLMLRCILLLLLTLLMLTHTLTLLALYLVLLISEVSTLLESYVVLVPRVVERSQWATANGVLVTGAAIAEGVADLLGGWLVSRSVLSSLIVGSLALSAAGIGMMRVHGDFRPEQASPHRFRMKEALEGLRWLRRVRLLRHLTVLYLVAESVRVGAFGVLLVYVTGVLKASTVVYGIASAAFGAGGALAGILVSRLAQRWGEVRTLRACLLLETVSFLGMAGVPSKYLIVVFVTIMGFTAYGWAVLLTALRQSLVPDEVLGRVAGGSNFLLGIVTPAGAVLAGLVAQRFTTLTVYWISAIVFALLTLASYVLLRETETTLSK